MVGIIRHESPKWPLPLWFGSPWITQRTFSMTYFSRVPKIETWQDWRIHHFRMWVRCFRFWGIHVLNWYVPQTIFSYSKFSKGDSSKLIWETIESHCPLRALLWNIGWQLLVDKESSEEIQSTLWTIAPSHVPSAGGKWEKLGCFILLQWYAFFWDKLITILPDKKICFYWNVLAFIS